jgi:hypothetical protein
VIVSRPLLCFVVCLSLAWVMSLRIAFGFRSLRHYLLFRFQLNHRYLVLLLFVFLMIPHRRPLLFAFL